MAGCGMADFVEDLRFRGLIHQMTDPELGARLTAGRMTGYTGFDPTATASMSDTSCSVQPAAAAGGRAPAHRGGRWGHRLHRRPGRQSEERSLLSVDQLEANLAGIRAQLAGSSTSARRPTARAR